MWNLYLSVYPYMNKETHISYEQFKRKAFENKQAKINISKEDFEKEFVEIEKELEKLAKGEID